MEIKDVNAQPTLMVRTTIPIEKISETMASAYGEIAGLMSRKGLAFAGSPYALYRNMDMTALDVEMGFPLSAEAEGEGRVKPGSLPGGSVAFNHYTGPYADIGEAYEKLKSFVKEKGRTAEEWCYEFYLNSPEDTEPDKLQTEIYFPLK